MKAMIEAGAACVHFEDQLSSAKKCGHLGGKVLVPTVEAMQKLVAARLAADVMGVPTLIMARTDADSAHLLTSDIDPRDQRIPDRGAHGGRLLPHPGRIEIRHRPRASPTRPMPTCSGAKLRKPDLDEAREFAEGVHAKYPGKMLAYNCSPSFNWKKNLDDATIAKFQRELGAMGYKFQFITLAGFHALNLSMFELARGYKLAGMTAYSRLQEKEFAREDPVRIRGGEAPALCRHRIFRRRHAGDCEWNVVRDCTGWLNRSRAVCRDQATSASRRAARTQLASPFSATARTRRSGSRSHEEMLLPSGD